MDIFENNKSHGQRRPLLLQSACCNDRTGTKLHEEPGRYQLWVDSRIDTSCSYNNDVIESTKRKRGRYTGDCHYNSATKILTSVFCTDIILTLFAIIFYAV